MGAKSGTANILIRLGDLARTEGDYEAAAKLYQESLDLSRELIENLGIASALHKLGYVARHRGDYDRAGRLFIESLGLQRELGNKQGIIECLSGLAGIALVEGRLERAGLLFGAVSALLESMNVPLAPADRAEYNRDVALARAQMEATSFDAAWQAGLAMTMETAINFTLAL
jgi:tetratricopeptide (TPR) repeat protein